MVRENIILTEFKDLCPFPADYDFDNPYLQDKKNEEIHHYVRFLKGPQVQSIKYQHKLSNIVGQITIGILHEMSPIFLDMLSAYKSGLTEK